MPCSCNQVRAPPQSPVSLSRSSQLGCGAGTAAVRKVSPPMVMIGGASSRPANALYPTANVTAATARKTSVTLDFMLRLVLRVNHAAHSDRRTHGLRYLPDQNRLQRKSVSKIRSTELTLTGSFQHTCGIE